MRIYSVLPIETSNIALVYTSKKQCTENSYYQELVIKLTSVIEKKRKKNYLIYSIVRWIPVHSAFMLCTHSGTESFW